MPSRDIDFEKQEPVVRGRIDALLGRTVFELKSDLRSERKDAEEALGRYLWARSQDTGDEYVGIATDGADFIAYFLRGQAVAEVASFHVAPDNHHHLLAWLQGATAVGEGLTPDPTTIRSEFGRDSLAARRALDTLAELWSCVRKSPEAQLERELWGRLLGLAYGTEVGDDPLFLQHTYLAVVAKAVAWQALIDTEPSDGAAVLHGRAFSNLGISGQTDSDFFSWLVAVDGGSALVMRIWRQVSRFQWRQSQGDTLKPVYEGLIDPETRHDLGEYYTPDWLAQRMVRAAVDRPLAQRVIDPSCGSGTFLFHAVRAVLEAAEAAKLSGAEAVDIATQNIVGIDIHPVAVIFARVTYLLALMPALGRGHPGDVALPIYMGDALQWNLANGKHSQHSGILFAAADTMDVFVPELTVAEPSPRRYDAAVLKFPSATIADAQRFDLLLTTMVELCEESKPVADFDAWIRRQAGLDDPDRRVLSATYESLLALRSEGRNHIWAYVVRNLARPVWLSSEGQKADVLVGNPPWVAYRFMSGELQERFRKEMGRAGLWTGGKLSTHNDLCAYFFLRSAQLYLRAAGRIAMVMPLAVMSRQVFAGLRRGEFSHGGQEPLRFRYTAAWTFGSDVQPLFPVPSCVLFAQRHTGPGAAPLPREIRQFSGILPRRDANSHEADARLAETAAPWPDDPSGRGVSHYRSRFRQGATLVPRRLVLVEHVQISSMLPNNPNAPFLRGRVSNLDKQPWKSLEPPESVVEHQFVRPVLLGESIAPYQVLGPSSAVVAWDSEQDDLMDANTASSRGYPRVSRWLSKAEMLWEAHKRSSMSFREQLDYYQKLTRQFPIAPVRVAYTKAGTHPVACLIRDQSAVVDHKLYWAAVDSVEEGRYLCALLNSEALRMRLEQYQSRGMWGPRDIDKYPFNLQIPAFDGQDPAHLELAELAAKAEEVAAAATAGKTVHFSTARQRVRKALARQAFAARIEDLAGLLFGGPGQPSA